MAKESSPSLLAAERREALLAILSLENRIDVTDAAERLGTSNETIRKDLIALDEQGLLRRVHGGALPVTTVTYEEQVEKRTQNLEEKQRIAQEALAELPPDGAIFIDSGSTTSILAEYLPDNAQLTVFTNSLSVVTALFNKHRLTCHLVGGRTRKLSQATVGPWAIGRIAEVKVDVAFVGTNAISFERGLSAPDVDEAASKAAMIRSGQRTVLLADHSKFGQESMVFYSGLDELDVVITGDQISSEHRQLLEQSRVNLVLV